MYFIIADDLTGATDTGIQFQKRGIATTVLVEPPKEALPCPGERTALSVNASSRELCPQEARDRTQEVMQRVVLRDQDTLFKKVDSLMRGNPVEELEAALEAAGRRIALAAPSFPRMGRTVDGGVLRLPDGSAKDLLALFRERAHMAVCHIPLARLRAEGAGLAADLVRRETPLLCLIDAVTEEDLSLAAEIGQALDTPPVYCGSAALAEALPVRGEQPDVPCRPAARRVLVVTGSQKKETAAQVRRLEAVCGLHKVLLDSERLLHEPAPEEISRAAQRLTELLRQEDGAILAFDSLFCSQTGFADDDVAARKVGKSLAAKLGEVLGRIDHTLYDGLILVGGDTAVAVCRSLQTTQLLLLEEVQSGTPAGLLADGPLRGIPVVTKSGAFGDEDTLLHAWKYIRREGE